MPKKMNLDDYLSEFYNTSLKKKYGTGNITPEIYKNEVLSFIKKMDPEFAINNIVEFLNQSAYDVTNVEDTMGNRLTYDKSLYPINFLEGLLKRNLPSKEVYDSISSKMSKDAYVNYCQQLANDNSIESKNAAIEYKINKFKMIEALKPTGNKFTNFFKKLFNIGGYNDKLAAYEACKQNIKNFVGDKLTNDEFENEILSTTRFDLLLNPDKVEKIDVQKEFENEKEVNQIIKNDDPVKEVEKEMVK